MHGFIICVALIVVGPEKVFSTGLLNLKLPIGASAYGIPFKE